MIEKELYEKLLREDKLTPEEMAALDAALDTATQHVVAQVAKTLPAEELSMSWRSELNEKLLALAPRRRSLWSLLGKPAFAAACAGAAMAVLLMNQQPPTKVSRGQSLEAALIQEHVRSEQFIQLAGASVPAYEAIPARAQRFDELEPTEVDLQAL